MARRNSRRISSPSSRTAQMIPTRTTRSVLTAG
jgi:hypothetical protein